MDSPPTIETLNTLLESIKLAPPGQDFLRKQLLKSATDLIKEHKLPYQITADFRLVEVGDTTEAWLTRFITSNPHMLEMKEDVRKLAKIDEDEHQLFTVLIIGPTGTGKELIARALHGNRPSKYLAVNCAGLPEHLIESELFGHVKGAFTDGNITKHGLMKAVGEGGTLFLDEIGELPLSVQAKLLRAIQDKRIRKVGAEKDEEISCRIIAATHQDIDTMAHAQPEQFRLDLFARLSTFQLNILPLLPDRIEDILAIYNSLDKGPEFLAKLIEMEEDFRDLDYSLNVRSIQQYVKRYKVLGKLPMGVA